MALDAQRNWDVSMAENLSRLMLKSADLSGPVQRLPPHAAGPTDSMSSAYTGPTIHLPAEVLILVIQHIFDEPPDYRRLTPKTKQRDICACSLVSWEWNAAATPFLYDTPWLQGPNYDPFTRTICPSINVAVRKSPLASFVRNLDLTMLVHQGSKSTTARLLGRTKHNLETFAAPQSTFSLNCFPALSKCTALTSLDLSLISEAIPLTTLFETTSHLFNLRQLYLPRSAGFGALLDPASIKWPPRLALLGLSGGLDAPFWYGRFRFPDSLADIRITHCPKLDLLPLNEFLINLATNKPRSLSNMTFANLPLLGPDSLNIVSLYHPHLSFLSISVDYVTPDLLNPFNVGVEQMPMESSYSEIHEGSAVRLKHLELTDSGDISDPEKFMPIDALMAISDYRTLPLLESVFVEKSLGWFGEDQAGELNELDEFLVTQAKERGNYNKNRIGVRMFSSVLR